MSKVQINTFINIMGQIVPILVALVTVPLYLKYIGDARYGVLSIIWVILGYFTFFNFGIGKAVSNQIAQLPDAEINKINNLFWTAVLISGLLGLIGGGVLLLVGRLIFSEVIKISTELQAEALSSIPWLALIIPITTLNFVAVGFLEGREQFLWLNIISSLALVLSQVLPLIVAIYYGYQLPGLIRTIILAQFVGLFLTGALCIRELNISLYPHVDKGLVKSLFDYGGWITISSIAAPLLTVIDQLLIGGKMGVSAVPYYSVPYNLATRALIVPSSLSRTLFPKFSSLQSGQAGKLGNLAILNLAAILTPVIVIGIILMKPFLNLWIGEEMAALGGPIGVIIFIGLWINSLAFIPYSYLQAQKRPDIPAKFHIIELPVYFCGLWIGITLAGLQGAAWAWVLRVTLDSTLLFMASKFFADFKKLLPGFLLVVLTALFTHFITFQSNIYWMGGIVLFSVSLILAWFLIPNIFTYLKAKFFLQIGRYLH